MHALKHSPRCNHMKAHGVKRPVDATTLLLVLEAPTLWMTTSLSLLSRQPNVSHHTPFHLTVAVSHVLDIPYTSMSLSQPALLRVKTAATVHTAGSITYVSSSIVRFRPSHNQLAPHEHRKGK